MGQILNEQICIYTSGQQTVFLLPITRKLFDLFKCQLSFSEGGAKHRGTASGVGGILRRD